MTEVCWVADIEDALADMGQLCAAGITFALDVFGTGYSSLYYLKHMPLFERKIDQSFARVVLANRSDAAIAGTMLALTLHSGFDVMAEGVETVFQRGHLLPEGFQAFQGYLLTRPLPEAEFKRFSERGRAALYRSPFAEQHVGQLLGLHQLQGPNWRGMI